MPRSLRYVSSLIRLVVYISSFIGPLSNLTLFWYSQARTRARKRGIAFLAKRVTRNYSYSFLKTQKECLMHDDEGRTNFKGVTGNVW